MIEKIILLSVVGLNPMNAEEVVEPPTSEVEFQEQVFILTKDSEKMVLTLISATECKIEYFTGETLNNTLTATYTLENNVITITSGENVIKANLNVDGTFTEYVEKEPEWYEQYLVDADGNGTPDFIDNWVKTELIGGITIGAIVSTCISLLGIIISLTKYGKYAKSNKEVGETYSKKSIELTDSINAQNRQVQEEINSLKKQLEETSSKLQALENVSDQLDSITKATKIIVNSNDKLVSNGTAEEVNKTL